MSAATWETSMTMRVLSAGEVGLPPFEPETGGTGEIFDLTSHRRAREALEFGLRVADPRFNVFVLGEERSGRLTATLEFVKAEMSAKPAGFFNRLLNRFMADSRL